MKHTKLWCLEVWPCETAKWFADAELAARMDCRKHDSERAGSVYYLDVDKQKIDIH